MAHWSASVAEVLASSSGDLRKLASIAKVDYRTLYRGQSLQGCDLRGQDLRGFDLTGCEIHAAKINSNTLIDPIFDLRPGVKNHTVRFVFPKILDELVLLYANFLAYEYPAWAYKSLFEHAVFELEFRRSHTFLKRLPSNEAIRPYFTKHGSLRKAHRKFQITEEIFDYIHLFEREFHNVDGASLLAVVGLISYLNLTDHRNLGPEKIVQLLS